MSLQFKKIGLFAKHNDNSVSKTFSKLIKHLKSRGHELLIEINSAKLLDDNNFKTLELDELGQKSDLIMVVGGDGSMLKAARGVCKYNVPLLGINRGRLGFLADIKPDEMIQKIDNILDGTYSIEKRFLLSASVIRNEKVIQNNTAFNDVVLYSSEVARMIEFEVYIDKRFMLRQRADGLITATPTGSTAYALSGGGPILYPTLDAITLVPMFPHTLTNRPIVLDVSSEIELCFTNNNDIPSKVSCDGQVHIPLEIGDKVLITKYEKNIQLIHPKEYNYFSTLREKLNWNITWR